MFGDPIYARSTRTAYLRRYERRSARSKCFVHSNSSSYRGTTIEQSGQMPDLLTDRNQRHRISRSRDARLDFGIEDFVDQRSACATSDLYPKRRGPARFLLPNSVARGVMAWITSKASFGSRCDARRAAFLPNPQRSGNCSDRAVHGSAGIGRSVRPQFRRDFEHRTRHGCRVDRDIHDLAPSARGRIRNGRWFRAAVSRSVLGNNRV